MKNRRAQQKLFRRWPVLLLPLLASCAPGARDPTDGRLIVDDDLKLVRGEHGDTVQREISVSADATLAVFVFEDDCDVTVRLEAVRADGSSASAEVENSMFGQSLEVAALDVPRGSRQFATDFYRRYTNGMPASRALAETQRAWMQPVAGLRATEQAHRRMTAWAHTYYTQ